MVTLDQSCENCLFRFTDNDEEQCRRYPPPFLGLFQLQELTWRQKHSTTTDPSTPGFFFPNVKKDWWCGEWKKE